MAILIKQVYVKLCWLRKLKQYIVKRKVVTVESR